MISAFPIGLLQQMQPSYYVPCAPVMITEENYSKYDNIEAASIYELENNQIPATLGSLVNTAVPSSLEPGIQFSPDDDKNNFGGPLAPFNPSYPTPVQQPMVTTFPEFTYYNDDSKVAPTS